MAGKRQHFLPQFLSRGFSIPGEPGRVWYFRRGAAARKTSTRDVGVEKTFYGPEGPGSLDDGITRQEDAFARYVITARSGGRIAKEDAEAWALLLLTLSARTRHIREGFAKPAERMLGAFAKHLSDPAVAASFAELAIKKSSPTGGREVRKLAVQLFRNAYGRNPDRNELVRARTALWRKIKPLALDAARSPFMAAAARSFGERLHAEAGQMTERAHIDALGRTLPGRGTRFEWLRSARWNIADVNEPLILGDVGPVAFSQAGSFEIGLMGPAKMAALLLPVSPHQVVIASEASVHFETPALNRATAELSRDFFVASERTQVEDQLQNLIGSRAELLSEAELAGLERNLFDEA